MIYEILYTVFFSIIPGFLYSLYTLRMIVSPWQYSEKVCNYAAGGLCMLPDLRFGVSIVLGRCSE